MNMPGFTAQASLDNAANYRHVQSSSAQHMNGEEIIPQDYLPPPTRREVCWWGNWWRDPSGYLHATYYCGGIPVYSF